MVSAYAFAALTFSRSTHRAVSAVTGNHRFGPPDGYAHDTQGAHEEIRVLRRVEDPYSPQPSRSPSFTFLSAALILSAVSCEGVSRPSPTSMRTWNFTGTLARAFTSSTCGIASARF